MTACFWAIAAIDALVLLVLFVMSLGDTAGRQDGGRAMGLFFFIFAPAVVLALAALMFHFGTSVVARSIALLVVSGPGLWFAKVQIEDRLIDRQIEADRAGTGYFSSDAMRAMGAAVVRRDVDTLKRIGPTVDVNAPGRDMTLMQLAVEGPDARLSDGGERPVVRALLDLGASPDPAMQVACVRRDGGLLAMLLAAGADPNRVGRSNEPFVFDVMSTIPADSFRSLAAHGLDLNAIAHGNPLPVQLAIYRRWDLLALAIELGADTTRARPDGRTVASELDQQAEEASRKGDPLPADLVNARRALAASRASRRALGRVEKPAVRPAR